MNKKSIKKLAVAIEKINYLYGSIKKNKGKTDGIELVLLKRYATELYDKVVEIELMEMAANKKLSDTGGVDVEGLIGKDILQESSDSSSLVESSTTIVEEPVYVSVEEEEEKEYIPPVPVVDPDDEEIWEPAPKVVEEEPASADYFEETLVTDVPEEEIVEEDVLERVMREQQLIIEEEAPTVEEVVAEAPEKVEDVIEEESMGLRDTWSSKVANLKEASSDKLEEVKSTVFDKKKEVIEEVDVDLSEAVEEEVSVVSKVWEEQEAISEIQQLQKEVVDQDQVDADFFGQQLKHQPTFEDTGDVSEGVSKTKVLSDLMETNPLPPMDNIINKIEPEEPPVVEVPKIEVKPDPEPVAPPVPEPVAPPVKEELNDLFKEEIKEISVADQLSSNTGGSEEFPISFNQRFAFINQLFDGDTDAFNRAIGDLGNSKGYIEALTYINLNLRHDYKWQDDDPVVKDFLDMIKKKYLG